jgi:hypothetical protein
MIDLYCVGITNQYFRTIGSLLEGDIVVHEALLPEHTNNKLVAIDVTHPDLNSLAKQYQQNDCQVIVSNLYEQQRIESDRHEYAPVDDALHLNSKVFFWIHEYAAIVNKLEYQDVNTFSSDKFKRALMPMNLKRAYRTKTAEKFAPILDSMYWSYRPNNKQLPGDEPMSNGIVNDRYLNPNWYKDTFASVVCETSVYQPVFLSEKTFKPFAYGHPFITIGATGTLKQIKELGFVTYDNLFDESYDSIVDFDQRLDAVYQQVCSIAPRSYDSETQQRIEHNRNLFYDHCKVQDLTRTEVIEPIIKYAKTK